MLEFYLGLLARTKSAPGTRLYRPGISLLLAVLAKLFLVDLAALDDPWRVASFIDLGLALSGVACLHRSMETSAQAADPHSHDSQ